MENKTKMGNERMSVENFDYIKTTLIFIIGSE